MKIADRFWSAVDSAIEAVIGAAIDVICREWPEETTQAAKEEGWRIAPAQNGDVLDDLWWKE